MPQTPTILKASAASLLTLPASAAHVPIADWVGTWTAAPMTCPANPDQPAGDSTYRNIMRTSIAGKGLRVKLTNEFGTTQLLVGSAHIALSSGNGAITPA